MIGKNLFWPTFHFWGVPKRLQVKGFWDINAVKMAPKWAQNTPTGTPKWFRVTFERNSTKGAPTLNPFCMARAAQTTLNVAKWASGGQKPHLALCLDHSEGQNPPKMGHCTDQEPSGSSFGPSSPRHRLFSVLDRGKQTRRPNRWIKPAIQLRTSAR